MPDKPGQGPPDNPGQAKKDVVFTIPKGEKPTDSSPFKVIETATKEVSLKSVYKSISALEQNIRRMKKDKEDAVKFWDERIAEAEETVLLAKKAIKEN